MFSAPTKVAFGTLQVIAIEKRIYDYDRDDVHGEDGIAKGTSDGLVWQETAAS